MSQPAPLPSVSDGRRPRPASRSGSPEHGQRPRLQDYSAPRPRSPSQAPRERGQTAQPRDARNKKRQSHRRLQHRGSCGVGFYNPRRRHSSIEYLSPIDYERRHYAMIVVPDDDQPAAVLAAVNRDRGASRDAAPPTPPGIRVRTTAVRRIRSGQRSPWRPVRDRGSEPSRSRDVAPRSC